MKELTVKGSYYEMGLQFGKSLKDWHREFSPSEDLLEFARGCEVAVKKDAPEILEELRGVSESSGTSYDSLISTNLAPAAVFGCTIFVVKGEETVDGSPIYARHQDWIKSDVEALHVIHSEPEGKQKSVGFSFGDIGRYGGMNEAGLTIASAYVGMYTGNHRKPGIRMNISARWVLDNFTTTEEAVDYLLKIPHTEPVNFLIADGAGTIARVETCPEKTAARYLDEGLEVVTVFYAIDEMKHLDKEWPEDFLFYEYDRRVRQWFEENRGSITVEKVKALCRDPQKGICEYYGNPGDNDEITIWSWIAETSPARIQISPGPPCHTDYMKL
ncbi:MAG: C45 family autoproteolytic acyltransferase/hydrolase [Candidatus Thorarchaeota archaeon]